MPSIYLSTLIGVKIGSAIDELTTATILGLVLFYMTYTTIRKSIKLWKEENRVIDNPDDDNDLNDSLISRSSYSSHEGDVHQYYQKESEALM